MEKIIFVGTTDFGIPTLEMLEENFNLVAVVTQPDRPVGRKKIITPTAVKTWAERNSIEVLQPEKISDIHQKLIDIKPDLMIIGAYGQILPKNILEIPTKGCLNLHASLLPKYRGATPIQNALLNGDNFTGVTIILMDEKMDHGPILLQDKLAIEPNFDYVTLHSNLAHLAAGLLKKTIPLWLNGTLKPQDQDHAQATFVKIFSREDGKIDWTLSAKLILQKIKALNPEPGTWTTFDNKSVKILRAEEFSYTLTDLPGKIHAQVKDCLVKCGDFSIKLTTIQFEGKSSISGQDFLNSLKKSETKIFI